MMERNSLPEMTRQEQSITTVLLSKMQNLTLLVEENWHTQNETRKKNHGLKLKESKETTNY